MSRNLELRMLRSQPVALHPPQPRTHRAAIHGSLAPANADSSEQWPVWTAFKPGGGGGSGSPALTARQVPGTLSRGQGLQSASSTRPQSPLLPLISSPNLLMKSEHYGCFSPTKALSATSPLCPHFAHPVHKDHKWVGTGTPYSGGSMGWGSLDGGKT